MSGFPVIPTAGNGRLLSNVQANTTATRTFPNLSSLTKNSGDLLLAIIVAYQSSATANTVWSGWTGSFTEFGDFSTTATMAIGCAYKFSTGSESGTIAVTEAATITGHAAMFLLSISQAHASTVPEAGSYASGTTSAADPASFNPSGWDVEDTLWIAVGGSGETGTSGTYDGITAAPANFTSYADTGMSADATGAVEGAVAFRQQAVAAQDVSTWTLDLSTARNSGDRHRGSS